MNTTVTVNQIDNGFLVEISIYSSDLGVIGSSSFRRIYVKDRKDLAVEVAAAFAETA
jgi:hypothetical protein